MAVQLYFDVHVPKSVTDQLRRRHVKVLTAIEDGAERFEDADLLERATTLQRVLVTQDIRFKARAELWQTLAKPFGGLVFAHQLGITIVQLVRELELIAFASTAEECKNQIFRLPF